MLVVRDFSGSLIVSALAFIAAYFYGGWQAAAVCLILGALEVSLSFDNAVINATVLQRMDEFWQRIFLTVGLLIAVFGMRLLFPLVIVWVTSGLNPVRALDLALNPPPGNAATFADGSPSYQTLLTQAHPQIAAFGGMFLFVLYCDYIFTARELTWLSWIERPLAAVGRLRQLPVVVSLVVLVFVAEYLASSSIRSTVAIAGVLGVVTYLVVNGLVSVFGKYDQSKDDKGEEHRGEETSTTKTIVKATGRAAFFLFLYLEVLDSSFSFDGVIGAFAITTDPVLIALGLGFIGAVFVRSLTVYLVHAGSLAKYRYLEHGAHWAIGALAVLLFITIEHHIDEVVTGLVGMAFIGAALLSSVAANLRDHRHRNSTQRGDHSIDHDTPPGAVPANRPGVRR